jgi:hypothetical protein
MNIPTVSLYFRKRRGIEPAVIEVSVIAEKMISESLLTLRSANAVGFSEQRHYYLDKGQRMVRFTVPGLDNDALAMVAWLAGRWYLRNRLLLRHSLN